MKVIQLIQRPQLRGAEIFACQLSDELISRGHDVTIVTIFDGEIRLPFSGPVMSINGSSKARLWDHKAWRKLARIIDREKPDIIQANAGDTLKYAVFSKLLFGWNVPLVFRNASTVSLYLKTPWAKWWNRFLYSSTDHIVSVSQFTRNDFVKMFPGVSEKISVAPVGIMRGDVQKNEQAKKESIVLLHVGGFTFEKNHTGLIRIFGKVVSHYPAAVLWLVGDGPLRPEIEKSVHERSLTDNVKFFGTQANVLQYFGHADLFVLPSIIEGLPAVILESFKCKVPVVAYDVGGIRELLISGKTGWLAEPRNEDGFVEAILKALEDKNDQTVICDNAYRLLSANYYIDKVTDTFVERYSIICGKG